MVVFQQQQYLRSFTQVLCILSSCSSSFLSLPPPLTKSGQQLQLGMERISLSGDWLKIYTLSTPVTHSEGRGACLANHIKVQSWARKQPFICWPREERGGGDTGVSAERKRGGSWTSYSDV